MTNSTANYTKRFFRPMAPGSFSPAAPFLFLLAFVFIPLSAASAGNKENGSATFLAALAIEDAELAETKGRGGSAPTSSLTTGSENLSIILWDEMQPRPQHAGAIRLGSLPGSLKSQISGVAR